MFSPIFRESSGDKDLRTSLRSLGQTDFFTKEIDEMVLQGVCRIAVHSAKDLPNSLPNGLEIIALTRGIDPSDSLVLREFDELETLPKKARIATSSFRREEMAKKLRPDFTFTDLRGTIGMRLKLLEEKKADGVIVAEAALIRLKLTYLNRIRLPGETAPFQGQLAIIGKKGDEEMQSLFRPLDSRLFPKALYLGEDFPLCSFQDRQLIHFPLIETQLRSLGDPRLAFLIDNWEKFTHLLLTSKSGVKHLAALLRKHRISPSEMGEKKLLAVGKATREALSAFGKDIKVAKTEWAEGLLPLIDEECGEESYPLWVHSSSARPLIADHLKNWKKAFSCPLYDTFFKPEMDFSHLLDEVQEIIFSSPTTVKAFFQRGLPLSKKLLMTPIGPITKGVLAKYEKIEHNQL